MTITIVDLHKDKKTIKELLSLLEDDAEVILAEGDAPVARLVAIGRRVPGLHEGAIWASRISTNRCLMTSGRKHKETKLIPR